MYVREVLLPSIYHLKRLGEIDKITLCSQSSKTMINVRDDESLIQAFPGHFFNPSPSFDASNFEIYPELYKRSAGSRPGFSKNVSLFLSPFEFEFQSSILSRKIALRGVPTFIPPRSLLAHPAVQAVLSHSYAFCHLPNRIPSIDHLTRRFCLELL